VSISLLFASLLPLLPACAGTKASTMPGSPDESAPHVGPRAPATAPDAEEKTFTVRLSGDTAVAVRETGLSVWISESSAKIGAPVSRVAVLVRGGGRLAEAVWVIESGEFESRWRPIAGRFWHPEKKAYEEGELPGWEIRLVSIDESLPSGSPAAVTIELRRAKGE